MHKSLIEPKAQQSWTHVLTHQIWVLAVRTYPLTCPPTRMLRQHVSLECTHPTSRNASQLKLSHLRHLLSCSTIPPSNPTTRGSSLVPSTHYSTRKRHLNPLLRSGAKNVHALVAHKGPPPVPRASQSNATQIHMSGCSRRLAALVIAALALNEVSSFFILHGLQSLHFISSSSNSLLL